MLSGEDKLDLLEKSLLELDYEWHEENVKDVIICAARFDRYKLPFKKIDKLLKRVQDVHDEEQNR